MSVIVVREARVALNAVRVKNAENWEIKVMGREEWTKILPNLGHLLRRGFDMGTQPPIRWVYSAVLTHSHLRPPPPALPGPPTRGRISNLCRVIRLEELRIGPKKCPNGKK